MSGPLTGLKVVEFAGLGPGPLAGQLLADLGADVVVVDRRSAKGDPADVNRRGKRSIALDLKTPEGAAAARAIAAGADVLIEAYRPGVMEKLGLGPTDLPATLIYGRMTGWGQEGPLARAAGHDLAYVALTGALHEIGKAGEPPVPPLNLVGDYAGGTMFLLFGVLAALYERQNSGLGQVIDAAMVDGVPALMGLIQWRRAKGDWIDGRENNILNGGAPFYRCYETADGEAIAVSPIEPHFFAEFLARAGLPAADARLQYDRRAWPETHKRYEAHFRSKTRAEWMALFEESDACVAPVLSMAEAPDHPHNAARGVFIRAGGASQAAPAPRFSRSACAAPGRPGAPGANADAILAEAGYDEAAIKALRKARALT